MNKHFFNPLKVKDFKAVVILTIRKLFQLALLTIVLVSCEDGLFDKNEKGQQLNGYISHSVLVDVDADGDLDLIADACCEETTSVPLFLNDGNGIFTRHEDAFPDRAYGYFGQSNVISPDDYNQDGHADVLIQTQDADYTKMTIQLFYGNGDGSFYDASDRIINGTFSDSGGEMYVADFDGDGRKDFLLTGYLFGMDAVIFLQDADGYFHSVFKLDELNPDDVPGWFGNSGVLVGDLDNDGAPDIVTTKYTQESNPEIVYARWLNYRNISTPGNLAFEPIVNDETEEDNWLEEREKGNGALVDLNGDGFLDLLTGFGISGGGTLKTSFLAYINDGTGRLLFNTEILNGLDPDFQHAVFNYVVADFDRNGLDDVFIPDHGFDAPPFPGHRNYLFMNTASGLEDWTRKSLSLKSTFTHGACAGDVNGDGYPDLFMNNSNDDNAFEFEERLWINNGDGTFYPSGSGL